MRFSERSGFRKPKSDIVKNELTSELRNSLWTAIHEQILNKLPNDTYHVDNDLSQMAQFFRSVWIDFFKRPIDNLSMYGRTVNEDYAVTELRQWFYEANWEDAFDLVDFCAIAGGKDFTNLCNTFLDREMSAYKFVAGQLSQITDSDEMEAIESAINNNDKFITCRAHLSRALALLSDKKSPDYRNSIKESISAVEALARIIVGGSKPTLGEALKEIENRHKIPGSLKSAFSALYGYTSDEEGIRHALDGESNLTSAEARFMLVSCSAFVNYLKQKIN